ncbi:MAG: hypothetical protein GC181_12060 [Bacteroidetes bacterium]|nr:hypothetical protein [Bacteroidota bacterium]
MTKQEIHERISEILSLMEINHNRLVLNESSFSLDLAQMRSHLVELYTLLDSLSVRPLEQSLKTEVEEKTPEIIHITEPEKPEPEIKPVEPDPLTPVMKKPGFVPDMEIAVEKPKPEEIYPESEPDPVPERPVVPEVKEEKKVEEKEIFPEKAEVKPVPPTEPKSVPQTNNPLKKEKAGDVFEKLRKQGLDSIKKGISIGKRYEIQNELFGNDPSKYNSAIDQLDNAGNFDQAQAILLDNLAVSNKWDPEHPLLEELNLLIQRRYL